MENAKTMREIALAAMREKVARELANATELVEGTIANIIMKSANEGLMEVVIHIPAGYSIPLILQILNDHGYKVCETQKFGNYLIKW
jgi:hypothetical protein